ncbi:UDP-N-acetylmuramoyl-tripeptide--D-alanyl-D-alanine ligase [Alkalicoccobacillus murimartini]|uniref:UDP-N-acetylmuramoyl-tripeptide--D-alanyl-D-alanine ligase n=1 Tax=Alkalicoccobacillus murimartini TaxID=171685 RepID=A0ABT9YF43_9BACI|nr:UDP-N-acetylmuramoyl-tripeptide--D-alanyl-D-alanine ligase [Alkalicoccobacillus murimartini]MDQ0206447.1 UDP-N-acetylmuramoyl-tripeptide--D-alanyl-D-alanine ligase [Alkalicoccobacillus murimartini]
MSVSHELVKRVATKTRVEQVESINYMSVSIDTRSLQSGALYIPIVGERFDGHQFLAQAIEAGAKAAIWQGDVPVPKDLPDSFQLYFVQDTLTTLQELAKQYRAEVNPSVIAVTGSNGKTTVKDMLSSILTFAGPTYKTQGNFNNHIGLPLTILGMPKDCQYLILEMGMSGYGEIHLLSMLSLPNAAVITNIGESHMEQLGSREGIAKAKAEIRDGLVEAGTLYIDGDEPLLATLTEDTVCSVGFSQSSDRQISEVHANAEGFHFTLHGVGQLVIPLLGRHNVKNAALAASLAAGLGLSYDQIQAGLKQVKISSMRLERSKGSRGELMINDAYNASPTSMVASLEALKDITGFSKYVAVLGDMYELGEQEKALHEQMAPHITTPITHLLTVGQKGKWISESVAQSDKTSNISLLHAATVEEATDLLAPLLSEETVVLLKASRGLKLEKIINDLLVSEKGEMNK